MSFNSNGFDVKYWNPYQNKRHKIRRVVRRLPFSFLTRWDWSFIANSGCKFIYMRSPWFLDGDVVRYMSRIKKEMKDVIVLLEVPTYDKNMSEVNKVHMVPLAIKYNFWTKRLDRCIDKIVTYSDDDLIYGISTIKTQNGIDTTRIHAINKSRDDGRINLIAVSSLAYWHGYDRVLVGLNEYVKNSDESSARIHFHIVGAGEEFNKYKSYIEENNLSDYVTMYGSLSGNQLDEVYEKADIALDSMGRHRSNVYYNSSLKGKEYCAKGLPIISGVKTELNSYTDFPYYMMVPQDDSPIDMQQVVKFYMDCYRGTKSFDEVHAVIAKFAEEKFDYSVTMKPVFQYIISNTK